VLSARRRLLVLLLVLTAGSCALAFTRLAAWWVMAPSAVMLLGYLALLREAAQADAERRQLTRSRAAQVAAGPLTPAAPPPPAPDAEIIDISASMDQAGEEFYDQYADAKLRAVGDLACAAHGQDLRAPERDVGVKGELLVRRQLQVRVAAGQFGHGDLRFELTEVRA
jgi:hypothetical protein